MKTKLRLVLLLTILFAGHAIAATPTTKIDSPVAQAATAEKSYWLTIKSGIRHNSKCRYFHNSNGRPCTKDEGRACKLCGG